MKTTLIVFFLLSLICLHASVSDATITCGIVNMKVVSCASFAIGKAPKLAPACCSGLQQLGQSVKSLDDKKDIYRCLKADVKSFAGVQDKFLSHILIACKIKIGFPISLNTICETIH